MPILTDGETITVVDGGWYASVPKMGAPAFVPSVPTILSEAAEIEKEWDRYVNYPHIELAAAIFNDAVVRAQNGEPEAIQWLLETHYTEDGLTSADITDATGVPRDLALKWTRERILGERHVPGDSDRGAFEDTEAEDVEEEDQ